MKFTATASVRSGKLIGFDRAGLADFIGQHEGEDVELTLKKAGRRSSQQNRYYFGVCIPIIIDRMRQDGVRITPEQLHAYFCSQFLPTVVPTADGEALTLPGRSSECNRKEFAEFVDAVVMWSWEKMGVVIPEPNTQTELKLTV